MKTYLSILVLSVILIPQITLAAYCPQNGMVIVPTNCQGEAKNCGVNDMICTAVNVSRIILGFAGSVALLMFIYGGFMWLISAGNTDRVTKGRTTFLNAMIGLALIFGAWIIINVVIAALNGQDLSESIILFKK